MYFGGKGCAGFAAQRSGRKHIELIAVSSSA